MKEVKRSEARYHAQVDRAARAPSPELLTRATEDSLHGSLLSPQG